MKKKIPPAVTCWRGVIHSGILLKTGSLYLSLLTTRNRTYMMTIAIMMMMMIVIVMMMVMMMTVMMAMMRMMVTMMCRLGCPGA